MRNPPSGSVRTRAGSPPVRPPAPRASTSAPATDPPLRVRTSPTRRPVLHPLGRVELYDVPVVQHDLPLWTTPPSTRSTW